MTSATAREALRRIKNVVERLDDPLATDAAAEHDPFRVLVSCVLSQRTKEETTSAAAERLFAVASTPHEIANLPEDSLAALIYPVGFYKTKAKHLREMSAILLARHGGCVPSTMEELLALPGVGRKTANLVLSVGFGIPAICVDTHVHRIANRFGLVRTRNPEATERALRAALPQELWIDINSQLVVFGRNVCTPRTPRCSTCEIADLCERVGVLESR